MIEIQSQKYLTPLENLARWAEQRPESLYLHQPIDGKIRSLSWREVDEQARRLASAFIKMGLKKGDRVAILAKNCAEWFITDYAIQYANLVTVPLYPAQSSKDVVFILKHCKASAIVIGKLDDSTIVKKALNTDIIKISMPYETELSTDYKWQDLISQTSPLTDEVINEPTDLMTIIYTSGSTGDPKGVMHTYSAFSYGGTHAARVFNINNQDRFFSYLPLSHVAERFMIFGMATYSGGEVYFTDALTTFSEDIKRAKPTIFFAVPRLWKKFQEQVLTTLSDEKIDAILKSPEEKDQLKQKIQNALGLQSARFVVSGAAPIASSLMDWYSKLGIQIYEGYGMTETLSFGPAINSPAHNKQGTVGWTRLYPNSEVRINTDSEILVRSPTTSVGYYLEPQKTAEAFVDNWLKTGDLGVIDDEGYLTITGRKKDVFKTSKGKFVNPSKIEGLFMLDGNLEQVCAVGTGLAQPAVLAELTPAAKNNSIAEIKIKLGRLLDTVNSSLESHEKVKLIFLPNLAWTAENGFLTPTLKIKRPQIEKYYLSILEHHQDSNKKIVWES